MCVFLRTTGLHCLRMVALCVLSVVDGCMRVRVWWCELCAVHLLLVLTHCVNVVCIRGGAVCGIFLSVHSSMLALLDVLGSGCLLCISV